jgi:hypothetical protein
VSVGAERGIDGEQVAVGGERIAGIERWSY